MRCAIALLAAHLAGCELVFPLDDGDDDDDIDAAAGDPDAAPTCFGTGDLRVCVTNLPVTPVTLVTAPGTRFDTDSAPECLALVGDVTGVCVVGSADLVLVPRFLARGARPLVIVSQAKVVVTELGVHSDANVIGAGAGTPDHCPVGTLPQSLSSKGGGGAGGSHAQHGAQGGRGNTAAGGEPGATIDGSVFIGGCRGQNGAMGSGVGGSAGAGGGAVAILATAIAIELGGVVNASGAGGKGGNGGNGGGGGGGAGGFVLLDAPAIDILGNVIAQGGGGGEGGGTMSEVGGSGGDPQAPFLPAPGGTGTTAGDGGEGSAGTTMPVAGGNAGAVQGGGGGGGGGIGVVRLIPVMPTGPTVSPPAS
jgi:hypothetical protein